MNWLARNSMEIALLGMPASRKALIACSAVSRLGIGPIFVGAMPFLAANVATMILCILFPALVLWLPSVFMG